MCIYRDMTSLTLGEGAAEAVFALAAIASLLVSTHIGLFCGISSLLQDSSAKETYDFKEPTNRSHPIWPR